MKSFCLLGLGLLFAGFAAGDEIKIGEVNPLSGRISQF